MSLGTTEADHSPEGNRGRGCTSLALSELPLNGDLQAGLERAAPGAWPGASVGAAVPCSSAGHLGDGYLGFLGVAGPHSSLLVWGNQTQGPPKPPPRVGG